MGRRAGWPSRRRSSGRCRELLGETDSLAGTARARQRRRDARAARRSPLPRQPLVGTDGRRAGGGGRKRGADVTLLAANLAVPRAAWHRGRRDADGGGDARGGARPRRRRSRPDGGSGRRLPAGGARRREAPEGRRRRGRSTLEPTADVLRTLGERRTNGQVLVGFAADHGEQGLARAREKLKRKRVDLVVYNDVSRDDIGFDAEDNEVVLVSACRRATGREGAERPDRGRRS